MRSRSKTVAAALLIGAAVWSSASTASAARAWIGDNYAETRDSNKAVAACDGEQDGNAVRADYYRGSATNYNSITNSQGKGTCAVTGSGTVISKFRAVEIGSFYNDYSSWVSP